MLVGSDKISNRIDSRRKGLFCLVFSGSHPSHRAQLFWGLCVKAEHQGRSCLPHHGWAAVRKLTCEMSFLGEVALWNHDPPVNKCMGEVGVLL